MNFAIIAAGEGSRLAAEGIREPKPLVSVAGERLIDRLIRVFADNGANKIAVICNDHTTLVSSHLQHLQQHGLGDGRQVPLQYTVRSTPSSMHSFYELRHMLSDQPFVLTTVDTIFREDDFAHYIDAFRRTLSDGGDALMGVTDYIDDEKPLYVGTDEQMRVTGFYDSNPADQPCRYISGGIYGLTPRALVTLEHCMERGESRMRNFQRALVADGLQVSAHPFSKVLDIDHASDIQKAEAFLAGNK